MPETKTPTLLRFAFAVVTVGLSLGCLPQKTEVARFAEAQPLMSYENPSPRFSLRVFMYAPGNLMFQVENLLPDFSLVGLPEIACPTGRVVQARLLGEEVIEFNVLLPGDAYVRCRNDVRIPWVLSEKGPDGFLRSEGEILIDIAATADTRYLVHAVSYQPAGD